MHPSSFSAPSRLRTHLSLSPPPKYKHHSPILSVKSWQEDRCRQAMASALTRPGMSGPAFSLYVPSLRTYPPFSDRRLSRTDPLCCVRRYPLRLRHRYHCGRPNHEGLAVRLWKIRPYHPRMRHHLVSAIPRRLHLVRWHILRCSDCSSCSRFPGEAMVRCLRCVCLLCWRCHANRCHRSPSLHRRSCIRRFGCWDDFVVGPDVSIRVFSQVDSVSFPSFWSVTSVTVLDHSLARSSKQRCDRYRLPVDNHHRPPSRRHHQ